MDKEIIGLQAKDKVTGEWKNINPKTVIEAISAGDVTLKEYIEARVNYLKTMIEAGWPEEYLKTAPNYVAP